MAVSDIINAVWDPLKTPLGLAGGALATRLWQRYLNRLAVFRWSVSYNHVAIAGATPAFGTIAVTWNGNAVTNLQFCNIEFENESGKDFQDVEVKFWFRDGTEVYGATVQNSAQFLPYTAHFQQQINAVIAPPPAPPAPPHVIQQVLGGREYRIPVLNRGTRLEITLLVQPGGAAQPKLEVYCDHKGARLVHRPQRTMFLGVVQSHAITVGWIIAISVSLVVGMASDNTLIVSITAFLMAAFGVVFGAGLIHLKRLVTKTIG